MDSSDTNQQSVGLAGSLGFILNVIARKASLLLAQRLLPYGISPEQWSVLYCIGEAEGLIQRELAVRAAKDKPTVTRILDILEGKGWILRQPDPKDRRSLRIYPTASGRELLQATIPQEAGVNQLLQQMLGDDTYRSLIHTLSRLNPMLEEQLNPTEQETT